MPFFVIATFLTGRKELRSSEKGSVVFLDSKVALSVRQRLAARIEKTRPRQTPSMQARYLARVDVCSFESKLQAEAYIAEHNSALKGK